GLLLSALFIICSLSALPKTALAQISGTPQVAWASSMANGQGFTGSNFTCRWITRPSIAGNTIRIHLSNFFSPNPETFNAVTVGLRTSRAAVTSIAPVTFGGQRAVTIPARSEVTSDPISFQVGLQQDIAVSLYYAGANPVLTINPTTLVTSYCTS